MSHSALNDSNARGGTRSGIAAAREVANEASFVEIAGGTIAYEVASLSRSVLRPCTSPVTTSSPPERRARNPLRRGDARPVPERRDSSHTPLCSLSDPPSTK
jgi:hypothetical protein